MVIESGIVVEGKRVEFRWGRVREEIVVQGVMSIESKGNHDVVTLLAIRKDGSMNRKRKGRRNHGSRRWLGG